MKGYLAAYDPALSTPTGDYWLWRSPRLPRDMLESYHTAIETGHVLENPNALASADLHGGALARDDQWCCFYRIYNGGRDLRGRPGRFVLVCFFVERADASRHDCSRLLDSSPFASIYAERLASGQAPELPPSLDVEISLPPLSTTAVTAAAPSEQTWHDCATSSRIFHWKVRRRNGEIVAQVDWLDSPLTTHSSRNPAALPRPLNAAPSSLRMVSTQSLRISWTKLIVLAIVLAGTSFSAGVWYGQRSDSVDTQNGMMGGSVKVNDIPSPRPVGTWPKSSSATDSSTGEARISLPPGPVGVQPTVPVAAPTPPPPLHLNE
jgi:hypothetical protein